MWGASAALRVLFSPVGKAALIVVAFAAWTAYQRHDATADCRSAQLQRELIASNEALKKAVEIGRAAELRAATATTEIAELERAKNELLNELSREGPQCILPDDVRERLLRIR